MNKKILDKLTPAEWESLCDHCALCCLQKLEDEKTGTVKYIGVACEFLDIDSCQCLVYENRHFANPDCIALTKDNIRQIKWLPATCAYRRLAEGKKLSWWHPLKSGDPAASIGLPFSPKTADNPPPLRHTSSWVIDMKKIECYDLLIYMLKTCFDSSWICADELFSFGFIAQTKVK